MTRLSILVGIGLMLVGVMAYLLPASAHLSALAPAAVGAVMALGGLWCQKHEHHRKHVMHLNMLLALVLMVWACLKLPVDWHNAPVDYTTLVADLDVLGLTAVYLYFGVKSFVAARAARQQAK